MKQLVFCLMKGALVCDGRAGGMVGFWPKFDKERGEEGLCPVKEIK